MNDMNKDLKHDFLKEQYDKGYFAGCHAQAEANQRAVEHEMEYAITKNHSILRPGLNVALAALDAAKIEEGK